MFDIVNKKGKSESDPKKLLLCSGVAHEDRTCPISVMPKKEPHHVKDHQAPRSNDGRGHSIAGGQPLEDRADLKRLDTVAGATPARR